RACEAQALARPRGDHGSSTRAGRGRALRVGGAPGIGKTRFVDDGGARIVLTAPTQPNQRSSAQGRRQLTSALQILDWALRSPSPDSEARTLLELRCRFAAPGNIWRPATASCRASAAAEASATAGGSP